MKEKGINFFVLSVLMFSFLSVMSTSAQQSGTGAGTLPLRPTAPCDIYERAGNPCVAAYSTTRALFSSYNGPLYQILRQSDGRTLDIGVIQPAALPVADAGGYADAAAQDAFCANTYCWIAIIYDQSAKHNHLSQAPRGGFSGPALGGFNNLPIADMAPITIMGHKAYGVFIAPGMGLRQNDAKGTAVDDQAEGQYWVVNGRHFNSGCCFDFGNAEIDSRDDDSGTMETTYFGNAPWWYHGNPPGPWIMTDQENNLVGCVNPDGSNFCTGLQNITWRFVTAMAKGEPHHWTTLGGDAQQGALAVVFDGPRIGPGYDPMRKQGGILLGNGGDNSNGSQGTFYEGAMTAAGTFPSNATDQMVQANVVAAHYDVARLSLAPASATANPPGIQTFAPGSSQTTTLTFTNTANEPVLGLQLNLSLPSKQWTSFVEGTGQTSKSFDEPVPPGATVSAVFNVTSGPDTLNGDLVGKASWRISTGAGSLSETTAEKVRNVPPVKINEFRISSGAPTNPTNSFIELYNPTSEGVDVSNWSLTLHPSQQAIFSSVVIPNGTRIPARGFYLLGLSNSGLAAPARAGDDTIYVRSTTGMSTGDSITVGSGALEESRKIASIGTGAHNHTTLWQPLPDGPVLTIPTGSTNVPVTSVSGFKVGQKIALGYGASYPAVANTLERYEVATVTAVGKPGTQAYLAAEAAPGATNIKVTSDSDISVGDKIRLDIDSVGHGVETVVVTRVGTQARRTALASNVNAGATSVEIQDNAGISVGDRIEIGTGKDVARIITAVSQPGSKTTVIEIKPPLEMSHLRGEDVVAQGTGLDLAAPLKFKHAANLPFSDRGTGISFQPATAYVHASNEPIQSLGTGIKLDRPVTKEHPINDAVRDAAVTSDGYQGTPSPDQWFGGPELTTHADLFGNPVSVREGSMVLRDAAGQVIDGLNYGSLVDPWLAKGYQASSGFLQDGCFAPTPGAAIGAITASTGRYPDGVETDSNCADFTVQATASLMASSAAGATTINVDSVSKFAVGQTILIDAGPNQETAVTAAVGTAGATKVKTAISVGATQVPVANITGFSEGQTVTIGSEADAETAVIANIRTWGDPSIGMTAPLKHSHPAGVQISGSGITLAATLTKAHAVGTPISNDVPTPGAPNRYEKVR